MIDFIAEVEDHKQKSRKQLAILNKNFIFMVINAILLPLTELTTIKQLVAYVAHLKWEDVPTAFSKNIFKSEFFFLRYMIQLTFISNGIQLLDLPHVMFTC